MTIKHNEMVAALVKPGQAIIDSLTPEKMHRLHMAVGIAGEGGELLAAIMANDMENVVEEMGDLEFYTEGLRQSYGLERSEPSLNASMIGHRVLAQGVAVVCCDLLDVVKKEVVYNKPSDLAAVRDCLATFEAKLAALRDILRITREETIDANIAKLGVRYKGFQYSDTAAQVRADKVEASA